MKGMIFTEFVAVVEQHFSPALLDEVLCSVELPCGGICTAVGQYGHGELVKAFGGFLFSRFTQRHPAFFVGPRDAFPLLSGIDDIIHPDVRKLYPDARPPHFEESDRKACEEAGMDDFLAKPINFEQLSGKFAAGRASQRGRSGGTHFRGPADPYVLTPALQRRNVTLDT